MLRTADNNLPVQIESTKNQSDSTSSQSVNKPKKSEAQPNKVEQLLTKSIPCQESGLPSEKVFKEAIQETGTVA